MNKYLSDIITNSNDEVLEGIPWLFKNSRDAKIEWSIKIQQYENEEKSQIQFLQQEIKSANSLLTKKRLSQICEAKKKNLKSITTTLGHFEKISSTQSLISNQQIHSYFQNIFRDWAWENNQECKIYYDFINSQLKNLTNNTILVLGSGASRLSYDLAKTYKNYSIASFDHNPFLLLTAQKIFKGHEIKLHDYTYYPKSLKACSKSFKIKVDKLENENHQFILGAFPDLPIKMASLDTIIAPWFFDILDYDFKESILWALKFLKPSGQFLFFGPSNVHKKNIHDQLCSDEIHEFLDNLFEQSEFKLTDINYLENPLTSQNRIEQIILFAGEKPILPTNINRPQDNTSTLNISSKFIQYKAFNQTYFHILKHIDKDMNFFELAKILELEFGFNQEESLTYARSFIQKLNQDLA